jgi:hypothetical protein
MTQVFSDNKLPDKLSAKYTQIVQTLDDGSGLIILEDHRNFPIGKSNIYKVGYDLKTVWEAELLRVDDVFVTHIYEGGGEIFCESAYGFRCCIDRKNGKIIKPKCKND